MPRPPLAVGTHGKIKLTEIEGGWRARASYRGYDGKRREISRWARTAPAAEGALKVAVLEQTGAATGRQLSRDSKVSVLAEAWLEQIDDADLAINTRQTYRFAVATYVLPGLSDWRLRELGVPEVDRALKAVRKSVGPGAAKTMRSVLSGMFGYAVRVGAMPANPIRDTSSIPRPKKKVRALTVEEAQLLLEQLRADRRAVELDLCDVAEWMLATGMRIGETCAVRPEDIDGETVLITGTVVRERGKGLLIQSHPKSSASRRKLPLTPALLAMLERRSTELRVRAPEGVLFPSPRGHLRDTSNTTADFREVFSILGREAGSEEPAPWSWVTSHTFRKTVATRLDDAGYSSRDVANFMGHEQPSMTQDVYMSRTVVNPTMAAALDLSIRRDEKRPA